MVLRFVFFLHVLVFICMSFSVLLFGFVGFFFSHGPIKKISPGGKSDQFRGQEKHNKGEILIPLTLP